MGSLTPTKIDQDVNSLDGTCTQTWMAYLPHFLHDVDSISRADGATSKLALADADQGFDSWACTLPSMLVCLHHIHTTCLSSTHTLEDVRWRMCWRCVDIFHRRL